MAGALAPSPTQHLLLRAVVLDGDPAQEAWEHWRAVADIERLDPGSTRLLPFLYRRLAERGADDPVIERLKGTYRYTWSANGALLRDAGGLLGAMADAGIPTVVLGGVALLAQVYQDQGARLADSLAVMVPPERLEDAGRLLQAHGWMPPERWDIAGAIAVSSQVRFSGRGRPVDLCWDPFPEACAPDVREACWLAAQPGEIAGTATRTLAPTDELLQICIRASRRDEVPPFRRLCDAMMVLRRAARAVDWSRLVELAGRARAVLPVRASLRLLRDTLEAPVPDAVLERLAATRVSSAERLEQRLQERPLPRLGRFPDLVFRHARLAATGAAPPGLAGLSRYLQTAWGAERGWQIPLVLVWKGARRAVRPG